MTQWKIYYGDRTTYQCGDPFAAPAQDVQMIANLNAVSGWSLIRHVDYYWYDESVDCWDGGEIFGLFDYLIRPGKKKVVFGRNTSNENFNEILEIALNDPELPQKSSWYPRERENAGVK